jgi:hypothetical protein
LCRQHALQRSKKARSGASTRSCSPAGDHVAQRPEVGGAGAGRRDEALQRDEGQVQRRDGLVGDELHQRRRIEACASSGTTTQSPAASAVKIS